MKAVCLALPPTENILGFILDIGKWKASLFGPIEVKKELAVAGLFYMVFYIFGCRVEFF